MVAVSGIAQATLKSSGALARPLPGLPLQCSRQLGSITKNSGECTAEPSPMLWPKAAAADDSRVSRSGSQRQALLWWWWWMERGWREALSCECGERVVVVRWLWLEFLFTRLGVVVNGR